MENVTNRINQVMVLSENLKYVVLKQAIYREESYFVTARLTDDEEDVLDEFVVFKEVETNGQMGVQQVRDKELIELVCKYVGLLEE